MSAGSPADETPEASLKTILYTLGTQAMIALGEIPSPIDGSRRVDLRQAKWHLDSLRVLQAKTQGNLTPDEEAALANVIAEVAAKYTEKAAQD